MASKKYWWILLPVVAIAISVPLRAWDEKDRSERRFDQLAWQDQGPRGDRPPGGPGGPRGDGERRPPRDDDRDPRSPRGRDDFRPDGPEGPGGGPRRDFGPHQGNQPGRPGEFPGRPGEPPFQRPPMGPDGPPGGHYGGPHGGPGGPPPGQPNWEQMKKHDPEMYELEMADLEMERKTHDLSRGFHMAPKDKQDELRKEIREVVTKHFEVRQQRRKLQLERMEKELKRMRDEIARRNDARDQVVNKRVADLTGERGELDF